MHRKLGVVVAVTVVAAAVLATAGLASRSSTTTRQALPDGAGQPDDVVVG